MPIINEFRERWSFLSNFYISTFWYQGIEYQTVEHSFQAAKAKETEQFHIIRQAKTPTLAKRYGRQCEIIKNWENIKHGIMLKMVKAKFKHNCKLNNLLSKTNSFKLIEGNYWHDNYWGDCYCNKCNNIKGKNKLGKILTKIRNKL